MQGWQDLEKYVYESKPFIVLGLGVYALTSEAPSFIALVSTLILLFAGSWILRMRFKHRKGSPLETLFYETQPFAYLILGGLAIYLKRDSGIAVGSGLILIFAATFILRMRLQNRRS